MNLLFNQDESESFDRKREFPYDNVTLLHDILCLCNSLADGERFLVYGVANEGTVTGVETDPNKKNNADIHDMLSSANLNRIPTLNVKDHKIDNHVVTVILIRNRPDKPFYLTKDKQTNDKKKCLRNGVIYTRIGDTNTPMTKCAPEEMVELMWRERLGIGKPPLHRMHNLLDDSSQWVEPEEWEPLYHKQFPEFTIVRAEPVEEYHESWMDGFSDQRGRKYIVKACYLMTVLETFIFISCDGGRIQMPQPKLEEGNKFVIYVDSPAWKIATLLNRNSRQRAGTPNLEYR